jgi:serine/threonine protein kinase
MDCGAPQPTGAGGETVAASAGTLVEPLVPDTAESERQLQLQQLLVEATLGEFEILGELGRGGMATVFLAHDMALERKVAIKVIAPGLLTSPGAAERFKREARTAAALSHPHIIPIHAVRETPSLLYFVMKFVEGRPLDHILRERRPLPVRMVQAILIEVGQALAYAHRRAIVHRDIKPANIMLDGEGWAVVTDFGIAKLLESDALTVSGAMIGTPYYMSPEQCAGKPVSGASDQYSLGIVAYEMLTGHPPFSGDTIMEIMKGHFFEAPAPVEVQRPDCPRPLAAVVTRMLAKEPAERWSSMDEAVAAMDFAPLAADDPVRSEMISLARSSEALRQISRLSVPVSPIPRGWTRARPVAASGAVPPATLAEEPEEAAGTAPAPRWKTALGVATAVMVLAGAGAGAALYFRPRLTVPQAEPPAVAADSLTDLATGVIDTIAVMPADSTPAPAADSVAAAAPPAAPAAPPKPSAEDRALQRDADARLYLGEVRSLLQDAWDGQDPRLLEAVGRDARARYELTVNAFGSLDDFQSRDPDSPLDRPGFSMINRTALPELPRSLRPALKLLVTVTPAGVRVSPR